MTPWEEIRDAIPCAKNHTYLMSAAAGPLHPWAFERSRRYTQNFFEHGDRDWEKNLEEVESVRARVAKLWNAKPQEICFLGSTSLAMSLFALILKEKFGYLDVLSAAEEFPSSTLPWVKQDARLRLASSDQGVYRNSDFEAALDDASNVFVRSQVVSGTGFRIDLEELSEFSEAHKVISVVNATQAAGVFSLDASQVDFACASIHKWLMSSLGLCVAKIGEDFLKPLPIAGWLSQKDVWALNNKDLDELPEAKALEVGCPSIHHIVMLGETLRWIEEVGGFESISRYVLDLVDYAKEAFKKAGLELVYDFERSASSGILMVRHPQPEEAAAKLLEQNVFVTGRGPGLRVALHYFNNEEDVQNFIKAYESIKGLRSDHTGA